MTELDTSFNPSAEEWAFVKELSLAGQSPTAPSQRQALPTTLPEDGVGERNALKLLRPLVLDDARNLGSDDFLAHMDPPTPWITWVTAAWAASRNQNLLHPDTSPAARGLESMVVQWFAPFFGMDGGHLVPGSTVANLTALWAARECCGITRVVASESAHLSVAKAAHLLGLGFHGVATDGRGAMNTDAMAGVAKLEDLSDAALVLTAGTTATGAIDPLERAESVGWIHVDAAWAGPLALSTEHHHLLEGITQADSVAVSGHKWLFQPKESAMILFKDTEQAHPAVSFGGNYLAAPNVGLLGSHGSSAASALAATALAWGKDGIAKRVDRCMAMATDLAMQINDDQRFELRHEPSTGVVLWRPTDASADDVLKRLAGDAVSRTVLDDGVWFRSVTANPMADTEKVMSRVRSALGMGTA